MNADVLTTRVADGIAVIALGSTRRIYFDEEMGDALTAALDGFAGDANVRVVVVTGGAPGYFVRHYSIAALIRLAESLRASDAWPGFDSDVASPHYNVRPPVPPLPARSATKNCLAC